MHELLHEADLEVARRREVGCPAMTPVELARELGVDPKRLRAWLRKQIERGAGKGTRWGDLDEATLEEARRWFGRGSSPAVARELTRTAPRGSRPFHTTGDIEAVRQRFRPSRIGTLFVGESAPAGGDFFYNGNSNLYRQMRKAFDDVVGTSGLSAEDFFERFTALGCYLDDLCLEPVNKLPRPERKARCVAAEPSMTERLRLYAPKTVVAIGKTYPAPSIQRALGRSGIDAAFVTMPFPDRPDQRVAFVSQLSDFLRNALVQPHS